MEKGSSTPKQSVPLQQGAVYMIDGRAHRMCACDNRSSICPRGLTRQIQTAGYNHCYVPTPDVVLVADGAVSVVVAPEAARSETVTLDAAGAPKIEATVLERVAVEALNEVKAWADSDRATPLSVETRMKVDAALMLYEQRRIQRPPL